MMMGVAKMLSHMPGADWPCYTADGALAAGKSSISYERPTASFAIDSFMFDWGNDDTLGHRRWLLVPGFLGLGYGFFDAGVENGKSRTGSCVVNFDGFDPAYATATALPIAYPPAGAFPAALASFSNGGTPQRLPWTITWADADFSVAKLSMRDAATGAPIALMPESPFKTLKPDYGQNTAMWIPAPVPVIGDRWAVRIDGLRVSGVEKPAIEYEVKFADCGATSVF